MPTRRSSRDFPSIFCPDSSWDCTPVLQRNWIPTIPGTSVEWSCSKTKILGKNPRMPQFDVTIAGELNLDLILYGLPAELPEERELLAQRMMLTLGSSSAIVAHNLAALGCRVGFVSKIGDDPLGQIAVERLAAGGGGGSKGRGGSGEK